MKSKTTPQNSHSKLSFAEQYKHPNWQKKRLEILERDNFTCQCCGDKESQLHVHHTFYTKGVMIWDHENYQLLTMCDGCHAEYHNIKDCVVSGLGMLLFSNAKCGDSGINCNDIRLFVDDLSESYDKKKLISFVKHLRDSDEKCYNEYLEMRYGKKVH